MRLGQQLLMDRKQLKNCTCPIAFAEKVVGLHLPALVLHRHSALTAPMAKESWGRAQMVAEGTQREHSYKLHLGNTVATLSGQ